MEFKNLKTINILTVLLIPCLAIVSIAGGFYPDTYERDVPSIAVQGMGQDLVNLFLVVPLLAISLFFTNRKNRLAAFLLGGALSYIMYSFVIYSLGIHFNQYFLFYVATLGLSLYAFILYMMDMMRNDIRGWFNKAPRKGIGIYLIIVAVIFYALWLSSVIPPILNDSIPQDVINYKILVNPVHVLDMAFALPALVTGAVLLIKNRGTGYLISGISLIFMMVLTIALAGMVVMLVLKEISEDYTVAMIFGVLTITSLIFTILFFKKLKQEPTPKSQ